MSSAGEHHEDGVSSKSERGIILYHRKASDSEEGESLCSTDVQTLTCHLAANTIEHLPWTRLFTEYYFIRSSI